MRRHIKYMIHRGLQFFGVHHKNDLRAVKFFEKLSDGDAFKIFELINAQRDIIVDVPVDRILLCNPANYKVEQSPGFVSLSKLTSYEISAKNIEELALNLKEFYENNQAITAFDFFTNLGWAKSHEATLKSVLSLDFALPWEKNSTKNIRKLRNRILIRHSGGKLSEKDGSHLFGPTSFQKCELEARRYLAILDSMRKRGYVEPNSNTESVTGYLIFDSKRGYKVIVRSGQHRIPVATILGYKSVKILIKRGDIVTACKLEKCVEDKSKFASISKLMFEFLLSK